MQHLRRTRTRNRRFAPGIRRRGEASNCFGRGERQDGPVDPLLPLCVWPPMGSSALTLCRQTGEPVESANESSTLRAPSGACHCRHHRLGDRWTAHPLAHAPTVELTEVEVRDVRLITDLAEDTDKSPRRLSLIVLGFRQGDSVRGELKPPNHICLASRTPPLILRL